MGISERRAREKEELRQRILDAATELCAEEGYAAVSIRRLAEKIEYAPSTIYLYFRDKTELMGTVCQENFRQLTATLDAIAALRLPPLETLRRCLRGYIEYGLANPSYYVVSQCLPEQTPSDQSPAESMKLLHVGLGAFLRFSQRLAECMEAGVVTRANVDIAAQSTWLMLHGITSLLLTSKSFPFVEREVLIDGYIDRILLSLGARVELQHPMEFPLPAEPQHSMTATANPPSEVSL